MVCMYVCMYGIVMLCYVIVWHGILEIVRVCHVLLCYAMSCNVMVCMYVW